MRVLITVFIMTVVIGLTGCGGQETAPDDETQTQTESQQEAQPITSEDFEEGEAEALVEPEAGEVEDDESEDSQ